MTEPLSAVRVSLLRNVGGPRLSHDGRRVLWLESYAGRADVVVAPLDGGPAVTVTSDPTVGSNVVHGGGSACWSPDDSEIAFVSAGDLYRVAASGGEPQQVLQGLGAAAPSWGADVIVYCRAVTEPAGIGAVRTSHADRRGGRLAVSAALPEVQGDGPHPVSVKADFAFDPDVSSDGRAVAWHEWDVPAMPWDAGRIMVSAVGSAEAPVLVDGGDDVSFGEPRFAPGASAGGGRLAYLCDRGGVRSVWVAELGRGKAALRRIGDGDAEVGSPAWGPGAANHAWSPDGTRLAYAAGRDGATELRVVEVATGRAQVLDDPPGTYSHLSWAGGSIAALYSDVSTPPQVRIIDAASGSHAVVTRCGLGGVAPLEATHLTWRGDDGGAVHGILVRAHAATRNDTGPAPLVVWTHGGPTDQSRMAFNPRLAWLVSRGYSVLFVNHRGSSGYGRSYARALYGRWGELDADDVASGARHMVESGIAAPGRMGIMGGSAGGYVVLQALIRHGELFTCGIDLYGVADLRMLSETTWRFEAHYTDLLVGPLPQAEAAYGERSPLHHAGRISVPLLILHGADDEVVPAAQSAAISDAVAANGVEVELHVYEGEGHGWSRTDTVKDELGRIETFLQRHLPPG